MRFILKEDVLDVDLIQADQEFNSAKTSMNSSKLPIVFKLVNLEPNTINLDYSGGRFDNVAEELSKNGITNLVYDPYNRSQSHNLEVLRLIKENGGADSITNSNVLNVIKEPEARYAVIKNIYQILKPGREAYFTVYEGSGTGEGMPTSAGYQLNKKTVDYVSEIEQVFNNVTRKGKLIIARK